jgi:NTP pyrophosphatase (non-canonical NTP hydrolase)
MTIEAPHKTVAEKLGDLRIELVELAVLLDRRGHLDAADVAMTTSARISELCEELAENG